MKKIIGSGLIIISLVIIARLNGSISFFAKGIPPLGKILDPINGFWHYEEFNKNVLLSGKTGDIIIKYDKLRVPHIYAKSETDLLFGQGYTEARDRLFQMEFIASAASGRLSEWFGDRTINLDVQRRMSGITTGAERTMKSWLSNDESKNLISAYVEGVNHYIRSLSPEQYPIEYKLFNKEPEEWSSLSTAFIFKYMADILAGRNDDIEMTNMRILLGEEFFKKLYMETEQDDNPIIPSEKKYDFDSIYGSKIHLDQEYDQIIYKAKSKKRPRGVGSNNWAISGEKSTSGFPILCNDPHLSLSLPSIWYEQNLITPEFNAYGVSFPGIPAIMIGFNEDIAWGETNVGHDVEDLFVIKWANEEKTQYWLDDTKRNVDLKEETIKIRGRKDSIVNVKYTYWGPVIHESKSGNQDLAKRWLVLDTPDPKEGLTFIKGMQCKDYQCYREATGYFDTPAQNFLFAARDGDIALRINGKLPAKHNEDGRYVEYGDHTSYDWTDFIPRHQNPQIHNPKQAYVFSANQRSTDTTYPYYYTGLFERYRNRIIDSLLRTKERFDVNDFKKMQMNNYSVKAEDFIHLLLAKLSEYSSHKYYKELESWDMNYQAGTIAPSLFEILMKKIRYNTWDEISEYRDTMAVAYPPYYVLLDLLENNSHHPFFDKLYTNEKETADDIVKLSFQEMIEKADQLEIDNKLEWGSYQQNNIPHLTRIPAFGKYDLKLNGCADAINAQRYSFGPSWRMIVHLNEKLEAYGTFPGGQSGDPRSHNYMNLIQEWKEGSYHPLQLAKIVNDEIVLNEE